MQLLTDHPLDSKTLLASRAFLKRLAKAYPSSRVTLFGSRARGDFREDSDADLAVFLPGRRGEFVATKLEMADIAYEVLLETGIRIQPLPIWEEEWAYPETYNNPELLYQIAREGVCL